MTPIFRMIILLMALFFILLVAGCAAGDCPVQKTTRIVSKISQNGTLLWTYSFDTGIQNTITSISPLSDGGIVISGSLSTKRQTCVQEYKARVVKFSDSGNIVWDRFFEVSGIREASTTVTLNDGGFVTVFNTGEIYKLDSDGNKVWSRNSGNSSKYWSAIETNDDGIVIAGPVLLKLNRDGAVLWQRSYPNNNPSNMNPVVMLENNRGFMIEYFINDPIVQNNYIIVISLLDLEGNFINSTFISEKNIFFRPIFSETSDGYMVFLSSEEFSGGKTGILRFRSDATFVSKQSINASFPIIPTKDNGYLYAEIVNKSVRVVKITQNETPEWNSIIPIKNPLFEVFADKIVQTSDGGYFISYGSWETNDLSK